MGAEEVDKRNRNCQQLTIRIHLVLPSKVDHFYQDDPAYLLSDANSSHGISHWNTHFRLLYFPHFTVVLEPNFWPLIVINNESISYIKTHLWKLSFLLHLTWSVFHSKLTCILSYKSRSTNFRPQLKQGKQNGTKRILFQCFTF